MSCIVLVMTSLTQSPQVCGIVIFGLMVKVGYCENDICLLSRFSIQTVGVILHSAELATIVCTFQDLAAYLLPILRVSMFIFGLNWHTVLFAAKKNYQPFRAGVRETFRTRSCASAPKARVHPHESAYVLGRNMKP